MQSLAVVTLSKGQNHAMPSNFYTLTCRVAPLLTQATPAEPGIHRFQRHWALTVRTTWIEGKEQGEESQPTGK